MVVKDEPKEQADTGAIQQSGKVTIKPITVSSPDDDDTTLTVKTDKPVEPAAPATAAPAVEEKTPEKTVTVEQPAVAPEPVPAEKPVETPAPTPEEPAAEPEPSGPAQPPEPTPMPEEEPAENEEADKPKAPTTPEEEDAAAQKAAEEVVAHDAAIQKLIDSQQYLLPINTVESRKTRRFVLLGVVIILVLAIAWMDVALDAGLVHISGIKALTHFFTS